MQLGDLCTTFEAFSTSVALQPSWNHGHLWHIIVEIHRNGTQRMGFTHRGAKLADDSHLQVAHGGGSTFLAPCGTSRPFSGLPSNQPPSHWGFDGWLGI